LQELSQAALAYGGLNAYTGVSTSRTLMLAELVTLFEVTPDTASIGDYQSAVINDNVLLKPSAVTRKKTWSYLRDRFALDPDVPIFRVLRLLWDRDPAGQPLLALLVAAFRDPVLRATVAAMVEREIDQAFPSREFTQIIGAEFPDRLTDKTLKSTGENTTSSYKQSGHLRGRRDCVRQRVTPTPGSTALALLFASLEGAAGLGLLESDWVRLLDSPRERVLAEARLASSRGWLEYRHAGDVLDISFRQLHDAIGESR
jgi:hypothetical protein